MSLSSAKAKLDAQGGDPVTGYISKADHQESYDELVDDTALTGATTAEAVTVSGALVAGTVNGRDPDDLVKGPASATDNALTRFDGTDGKTVQNSGITVDDSGNITSDLTISKSSAALNMTAAAGSTSNLRFQTGGTNRWTFFRNSVAESGSNAGSDFQIYRYTDGGSGAVNVDILRATGKWTFRDCGATAGLELGTSGPRIMSGTGSPEGVVTAPVGSRWIRTDGATLGDFEYQKRSGTGSTGWVVADGDTGWRQMSGSLLNSWATGTGGLLVRRSGNVVQWMSQGMTGAAATDDVLLAVPAGFLPNNDYTVSFAASNNGGTVAHFLINSSGNLRSTLRAIAWSQWSYLSDNAWPSSLPGSAA